MKRYRSYRLSVSILLLTLWVVLVHFQLVKPIFLPSLQDVFSSLLSFVFSIEGLNNIFSTFRRMITGFLLGILFAIPAGIFLGLFKRIYESIGWFIDFCRSVPVTALFPLFLIFFGFGDTTKIVMCAWASGFIVLINTIHGVWSTKENRRVMALTKRATSWQVLTKITLPESLPFIFAGMRIGISWALIVVIVAEMFIGTQYGMGRAIYNASITFDTPRVMACILLIGFIGLSLNRFMLALEKRIIHWNG